MARPSELEEKQQPHSSSRPPPRPSKPKAAVSVSPDMIYEIFAKLPVKSLMRFHCVSKLCSSCITSPSFATSHSLQFNANTPVGLLVTCPTRLQSAQNFYSVGFRGGRAVPLISIPPRFSRYTSHPVNGLVLMDFGLYATIFNPSTRQAFNLPLIAPSSESSTYFCINSFGFDPVREEYKILNSWTVRGPDDDRPMPPEYKIFQLGSNSNTWRPIKGGPGPDYYPQRESICIDGVVYFRGWVSADTYYGSVLVAFDVHNESFRVIKIPIRGKMYSETGSQLIAHSGRPALAEHLVYTYKKNVSIWVLDGDDSWSQRTVYLPWDCSSSLEEGEAYAVHGFVGRHRLSDLNNELLLVPRKMKGSVSVVYYHLVHHRMRIAPILGLREDLLTDLSSNIVRVVTHYEQNLMHLA